jgi:hypothetical protein
VQTAENRVVIIPASEMDFSMQAKIRGLARHPKTQKQQGKIQPSANILHLLNSKNPNQKIYFS